MSNKENRTSDMVLKIVASYPGLTSTEVAKKLSMSESGVRNHLKAGCALGEIIRREEDGKVLYFSPASPAKSKKVSVKKSNKSAQKKRVVVSPKIHETPSGFVSPEIDSEIDKMLSGLQSHLSANIKLLMAKTLISIGNDLL